MYFILNSTKLTQGVARIMSQTVEWEAIQALLRRYSIMECLEGSCFLSFLPSLKFLHLNVNLGKQYSSVYMMPLYENSEGK